MKSIKKIFSITIFVFCLFPYNFFMPLYISNAYSLTNYVYARIENSGCYLYKDASTDLAFFVLPKTYFVLLISNFDEEFYKVQYRDLVGFVLKSNVQPVKEKPDTPYLENVQFRVFSSDGKNVLSSPYPSQQPSIVETIPKLSFVNYYGEMLGEEQIEGRGTTWYYAKTEKGNLGYIYSGLCDNMSEIIPNDQSVTPLDSPFNEQNNDYLYNLANQSIGLTILIIILISLPALLLIYLLFKPYKLINNNNIGNCKKQTKHNNRLKT